MIANSDFLTAEIEGESRDANYDFVTHKCDAENVKQVLDAAIGRLPRLAWNLFFFLPCVGFGLGLAYRLFIAAAGLSGASP